MADPCIPCLINVLTYQRQSLLLQILGMGDMHPADLLLDLSLGLGRSLNAPKLMEGIHIKRKVIKFILINGNGRVYKVIKFCKLIDIIPYSLSGSMKNMGSITMNLDSLNLFSINISSYVVSFINNQTGLIAFCRLMCKYSAKQTGAHDQIIIFFHFETPSFF